MLLIYIYIYIIILLYTVIFGSFTCIAVSCGHLGHPPKGRVTTSGYSVGSTATYSCEVGYALEGESERECLVTGEWSGNEPVCTGEHISVVQLCDSYSNTTGYKFNASTTSSLFLPHLSSSSPACSY